MKLKNCELIINFEFVNFINKLTSLQWQVSKNKSSTTNGWKYDSLTNNCQFDDQRLLTLIFYIAGTLASNEIREIFDLFDKNKKGTVNTAELGTLVRALNLNPTETEINEMQ